jgi:hypothetical protein
MLIERRLGRYAFKMRYPKNHRLKMGPYNSPFFMAVNIRIFCCCYRQKQGDFYTPMRPIGTLDKALASCASTVPSGISVLEHHIV